MLFRQHPLLTDINDCAGLLGQHEPSFGGASCRTLGGDDMQCANCHRDIPDGSVFCPQCGSPLANAPAVVAETPPEAPSLETQAQPPADKFEYRTAGAVAPEPLVSPPPPPAVPEKKRKRHGCLIAFGIFLLLIALALAVLFDLPMRLGLISSPAEKMFTEPADPEARATLTQDFEQAGQPTKGISFYVLPFKDRGYSLAYVVLDQSQGYRYVDTGFDNPVFAAFGLVARSKAVEEAQIYRVAVEFREPDGSTLCVLTAPVFAIQQYAAKTIDKKQFIAQMDGHANLARMYKDQYSWLGGPQ